MTERPQPLPRTLCLAGADGAGKSTQAERLAARLSALGHEVRLCTVWDMLLKPGPAGSPFESKAAIDRFLASLHAPARAMFLHMAMREALDRALQDRGDAIVLVVGYWLKYNATERLYGAPEALLDALGASFPPLSLGIELALEPDVALARKREISGYESGGAGRPGFLGFQRKLGPVLSRLRESSGMRWEVVDGAGTPDEVEGAIARHIDAWLAAGATA